MQTESMIELLKQTLKFYAEEKNYSRGIVEKDGGHQARHGRSSPDGSPRLRRRRIR